MEPDNPPIRHSNPAAFLPTVLFGIQSQHHLARDIGPRSRKISSHTAHKISSAFCFTKEVENLTSKAKISKAFCEQPSLQLLKIFK
jgi:hypothetical protein